MRRRGNLKNVTLKILSIHSQSSGLRSQRRSGINGIRLMRGWLVDKIVRSRGRRI